MDDDEVCIWTYVICSLITGGVRSSVRNFI